MIAFSPDRRITYVMEDGDVHCLPTDDTSDHEPTAWCWCNPGLFFRSSVSGREVWIHAREKDGLV